MRMIHHKFGLAIFAASLAVSSSTFAQLTPAQAEDLVKKAYIFGFPVVDSYRVQYSYFIDKTNPEYKGNWNELHNIARVYTPKDTAVQTPNSDTPYSFVGADLRTEPLVLTVPKIEKIGITQFNLLICIPIILRMSVVVQQEMTLEIICWWVLIGKVKNLPTLNK